MSKKSRSKRNIQEGKDAVQPHNENKQVRSMAEATEKRIDPDKFYNEESNL
ncbi:hypothetical protein [Bacillus alkalicellulosilyticus]|uniref:hypothetical protein n=1 Tax=Alkalihalobacterium alkalicellulosilyticum TaxID=1912214 RepID=UPI001482A39D|nr:hypothetical protein [Bacillus alkalicellulosilyticus]